MNRASKIAGCTGGALLGLLLLRCSPIAPSLNKTVLHPVPVAAPFVAGEQEHKVLVKVPVKILRGDGMTSDPAPPSAPESQVIALSEGEVHEFKSAGSVKIGFEASRLPNTKHAWIQVETGRNRFQPEEGGGINLLLSQENESSWVLKVTDETSEEASRSFRDKIVGLSMIFVPEPSPSASPSPSMSPSAPARR